MRKPLFWKAFATLGLSLGFVATPAVAADRWYEVEVLVFAHLTPDSSNETWPSNDSLTLALDSAILAPNTVPSPSTGQNPAPSAQELLKLAAVPPAQYKLLDSYKALSRSRNYRPLLHTAWRQPIGTGKSNFKIRLAGGKDYANRYGVLGKLLTSGDEPANQGLWEVDGFIRLSAAKFLHAETELLFRRPGTVTEPSTATTTPTDANPAVPVVTATAVVAEKNATNLEWKTEGANVISEDWLQFFKLDQSRRLKANEVSYFDHPMFGLIIVLRPLEPERSNP